MKIFLNKVVNYPACCDNMQSKIVAAVWVDDLNRLHSVYVKKANGIAETAFVYYGDHETDFSTSYSNAISHYIRFFFDQIPSIVGDDVNTDAAIIMNDYRMAFKEALRSIS